MKHTVMEVAKKRFFQVTLVLLTTPVVALANAGSPMMWFGILHLLLLNAIIGTVESGIISKFKIPNRTAIVIIANYVSMFIGLYFIAPHFSAINGDHNFWGGKTRLGEYHVKGFAVGMISACLATLIIELPFVYFAVKEKIQRNKILFPFLIANTVTNIAMGFIYYLITGVGEKW